MSKIAITLDDYVCSSIFNYPSLYLKDNFENSRMAVLKQTFQVIGNGVEYCPNSKNFNNHRYHALAKEKKARLKNGEKLVEVCNGGEIINFSTKKVWRDLNKYDKTYFSNDFIKLNIPHLINGQELPKKFKESKIASTKVIEIYPNKPFKESPYPYSLTYTPMWENGKLIEKELILEDWRKGIVDVYEWALDWMESDKFNQDHYYNWSYKVGEKGCIFTENWNNKKSVQQICKDYEIAYKEYSNPKEMAIDIVSKQRKNYINTAKRIINAYKNSIVYNTGGWKQGWANTDSMA